MISKRLHPASFSNANAQLAQIASYTTTPIATYTVSGNKEVVVTSVDLASGTFTAVGHGLVEGNVVVPILNLANIEDYPIKYMPTGLVPSRYYIKYLTADTFQVSLTSGGAAVTFTTNETQDLSKWHFQKYLLTLSLTSLGALQKCKIIIKGQLPRLDTIVPYNTSPTENGGLLFLKQGTGSINQNPNLSVYAAVYGLIEAIIDCTKGLYIKSEGYKWQYSTASENSYAEQSAFAFNPDASIDSFDKIYIADAYLINGTTVEVYNT